MRSTCFSKETDATERAFWKPMFEIFPLLCDFVADKRHLLTSKAIMFLHLKNQETEFPSLFKNLLNAEFQWVLNPFVKNTKMQHIIGLQENWHQGRYKFTSQISRKTFA